MLLAVTLQDEYHYIARRKCDTVIRLMEWGIESKRFLVAHVCRNDKRRLFDGAQDRKRRVQHDARFGRAVDVLVGVADGDGAGRFSKTATDGADAQRDGRQERQGAQDVIAW